MNVMLDLETLSLNNNPVILSIGAVVFNKKRGITDSFNMKVSQESCVKYGLHTCPNTVAWWEGQSAEAKREAFGGNHDLKDVLIAFTTWLNEASVVLWGNGATADNVWLRNAYIACGLAEPWHFTNDRCFRTILNVFPVKKWTKPLIAHSALEDARSQAINLMNSAKEHNYDF